MYKYIMNNKIFKFWRYFKIFTTLSLCDIALVILSLCDVLVLLFTIFCRHTIKYCVPDGLIFFYF